MRFAPRLACASIRAALASVSALALAATLAHAGVTATGTLDRIYEAVVAPGSTLPGLAGAAVTDLWVYAYRGGAWVQIPFQLDQKDASGNYFVADSDPTFDSNDELVWMAKDMGDQVTSDVWPSDLAS